MTLTPKQRFAVAPLANETAGPHLGYPLSLIQTDAHRAMLDFNNTGCSHFYIQELRKKFSNEIMVKLSKYLQDTKTDFSYWLSNRLIQILTGSTSKIEYQMLSNLIVRILETDMQVDPFELLESGEVRLHVVFQDGNPSKDIMDIQLLFPTKEEAVLFALMHNGGGNA